MATEVRMERAKSDIALEVATPSKSTNLIEWNVDMRVTVSSVKKSKMFQRSRNIVIFLLAIVFAIVLSHFRREVRTLQVQMQSVNVNLLVLMSKYDRLNRSLNRAWIQRSNKLYDYKNKRNIGHFLEEASTISKTSEIISILNTTDGRSNSYNSIVPLLKPVLNLRSNIIFNNDIHSKNERNDRTVEALTNLRSVENDKRNNIRIERAVPTYEKENFTTGALSKREKNIQNDYDDSGDLDMWKEPRSGRSRRDEGRGKKRGKNKRRPKRSRRRLGISSII